eukprot:TRINITY_DN8992_c0_g1_i2.p1 TRINITY_DN8992_c0_g1~~TRINITY_DN8992_c0_g1_i2.p1  ORF type:complete len:429 (-),score=72.43 TRINITY_DN8992_c0_g1_i2:234-1520(-)
MASSLPSVLMVGTGEYTTGFVDGKSTTSDKRLGVVALSMFYLRSKGKINRLLMAGSNGTKFPGIRQHFAEGIQKTYKDLQNIDVETFPADDVPRDPKAFLLAMDTLEKGDLVIIFTPDDTHYDIAKAAVTRGLHVLVTKPAVKSLQEHLELIRLSREHNSLVCIELHKRWDPIYQDARSQIMGLGDFSHYNSYMSQPKKQLETFRGWQWGKGKSSSDISYYLNSHHIDFHCWLVQGKARPVSVVGMAATGVASSEPFKYDTEDTITLMVQWQNISTGSLGTALYTSSWIAPTSDVHSQQRFFYMGHRGEVTIDQAHRGYNTATDTDGYKSTNPLFMKYTPDARGNFGGQHGYGFQSFEAFVEAATRAKRGEATAVQVEQDDVQLGTIGTTAMSTAIMEAGRRSIDEGKPYTIVFAEGSLDPVDIKPTH